MKDYYATQKRTNVPCDHKGCKSIDATIVMRDRGVFCATHAFYLQTGRHLCLEKKRRGEENAIHKS